MSSAENRRRARRGLLVLLDGIVIAILAAVITVRSSGTGVSDLASATVGILTTWVATPGVEIMEAIAYVGFAVAVLGPLWFWGIRSFVSPVSVKSLLPSRDSSPEELEFAQQASTVDRKDERGQISDGGGIFRTVLADELQSNQPDWTEAVFGESTKPTTMAVPEGDFLRGGGSSEAEEIELIEDRRRSLRATFGPPEDDDAVRSVDIHESPETSEAEEETTGPVAKASHDADRAEPTASRSDESEFDDDLLEAIGADEPESEPAPAGSEADENATASETDDPLERLSAELNESQARIGAVEERIAEAATPNGVETAGSELGGSSGGADDAENALEDALSNRNPGITEAIDEIRADQTAVESALDAVGQQS